MALFSLFGHYLYIYMRKKSEEILITLLSKKNLFHMDTGALTKRRCIRFKKIPAEVILRRVYNINEYVV